MSEGLGGRLRALLDELAVQGRTAASESMTVYRIDACRCQDSATLGRLRDVAMEVVAAGFGEIVIFDEVSGTLDLEDVPFEDVEGIDLSVRLEKASDAGWRYFITEKGFRDALSDPLFEVPAAVWVATTFEPFSSTTLLVSPWDGPRDPPKVDVVAERPLKFVRDLTRIRTPKVIGPWLLTKPPVAGSVVYAAWSEAACQRLAYVLPSEVREVDGRVKVVLKGARSTPIDEVPNGAGWAGAMIEPLSEAASWIYAEEPKTAETRFVFLNNHLSLAWREGHFWPDDLLHVLREALVNAREAYAFHLQGESKEALKTLGDLRKSLQEEVSKAQGATRDLIASLWRDLGVAGVVLALRSPAGQQIVGNANLRFVPLVTAVVLALSLIVTIAANARFGWLSDKGRRDWRTKLYAFVSEVEWARLVDDPISKTRWVYRLTLPFVIGLYAAAVWYLLAVTDPSVFTDLKSFLK